MLLNIVLQVAVLAGLWLVYRWMFTDMAILDAKRYLFMSSSLAIVLCAGFIYEFVALRKKAHVRKDEQLKQSTLEYSHELFSELYRSGPVPYIVISEKGVIESINFSCARLFNVSLNTLDGRDVFSFLVEESSSKVALIPEYFKEGKFVNDVEMQIQRPDETHKWVLLSLFSFKDVKGKRKGLLTLVDITKQKMIDKAKTEFVSLASHQLRTPISSMKWNIELLLTTKGEGLDEAQKAYIEKVSRSLGHMDMLVGDFLSASKFEVGTLTPIYTAVDLMSFIQGVYDEHAEVAKHREVRIETAIDAGTIHSDSHFLHMIVSNLLGNAVKYTPSGGVVRLGVHLDDTNATITVADTGIGIPADDQSEIFSKMFRASNAQASATDGTGLGLYIVKEAVKTFGGTISFESKEGVGTTFTVILPK